MSQPAVNLTEQDGAIGVLPAGAKLLAFVGPADSGPIATPAAFAKKQDIISIYGGGPTVEAACHAIDKYKRPVLFVRTTATTQGAYLDAVSAVNGAISSITKTGTGSSVFTNNASAPVVTADTDVIVLFNVGGTRGTAGIVYQISLDGGSTYGSPLALGTATTFAIGSTGASIAIGAGTVVAGDFIAFTLTAPILASAGELVTDIAGTSVPTTAASTYPNDDYEVYLEVITGGTIGVAGITFKYSLDGGRTMSSTVALGTAAYYVIPSSGGTRINFAAGTLIAGDNLSFPTVAPCWNTTDLGVALDALGVTTTVWELAHIVGPMSAAAVDLLETKFSGFSAAGKERAWIAHTRMPVGDESEATYLASLAGVFGTKASTYGLLCAGACEMPSAVTGRTYRRPASHPIAALQANVSEEVNIAEINVGLLAVSIRDTNGNAKHHDESSNPGLDDARFCVLRTHAEEQGVYVNRPRLFSADGSDFQLMPHRRIMGLYKTALRRFLVRRLNKDVFVDATTGFILEEEALEIEAGANALADGILKGKVSSHRFTLSRTDNLLSTKTMTGQGVIVSKAYPETINIDVGFSNPANNVQAV